jgi:hypothetical protein
VTGIMMDVTRILIHRQKAGKRKLRIFFTSVGQYKNNAAWCLLVTALMHSNYMALKLSTDKTFYHVFKMASSKFNLEAKQLEKLTSTSKSPSNISL